MQLYGADKVWRQMNREGIEVARCTVERLMGQLGLAGVRRGKVTRTTIPDKAVACPLDRVNRQFKADRPNQLWVSDFTYVSTWQGWLYVAFVIDVFARRIVSVQATHLDELADCLPAKHIIASALDLIIDRAHVYAWCTHVRQLGVDTCTRSGLFPAMWDL